MDNEQLLHGLNTIASTLMEYNGEQWTASVIIGVNRTGKNDDFALSVNGYKAVITARAIYAMFEYGSLSDRESEKYVLDNLLYIADTIFDYNPVGWDNCLKKATKEVCVSCTNRVYLIMSIVLAISTYILEH